MKLSRQFWVGLQLDLAVFVGLTSHGLFVVPAEPLLPLWWMRATCAAVSVFWIVMLGIRLRDMRREAKEIEDVLLGRRAPWK